MPDTTEAPAHVDPALNRIQELAQGDAYWRSSLPLLTDAGFTVALSPSTATLTPPGGGQAIQIVSHGEFVMYMTGWIHGRDHAHK